jgi:excisionase family DNA binding protein
MKKDDLLSRQEVIEYLKISPMTLHRLLKSRAFPYIKLARRVLFRKADIDKFLESKLIR